MLDHITVEINKLVDKECQKGISEKGLFVDGHQGYAVLKEEVEECREELQKLINKLNWLWLYIRKDEDATAVAAKIKQIAELLAAEGVQAAAMAQKFIESLGKKQ